MSDIKAALITGGTKGIGFSIAESFLANNIKLCITGRTQESIDKALQKLNHHDYVCLLPQKVLGFLQFYLSTLSLN